MSDQLDQLCINTLRFLSVDMVQKANSGHPGLPLGAAPMAYVLWTRFLKHNPAQSALVRSRSLRALGRARLGAALQPAAPHRLRPLARRHQAVPPVGQQDAGASRARPHAGRRDDDRAARPGPRPTRSAWRSPKRSSPRATTARPRRSIDHRTYAIVSDGDLMEGVALGGGVAGRPPAARQADLSLRRQLTSRSRPAPTSPSPKTARSASRPTAGRRSASPTATTSTRSTRRCARRAPRPRGRR